MVGLMLLEGEYPVQVCFIILISRLRQAQVVRPVQVHHRRSGAQLMEVLMDRLELLAVRVLLRAMLKPQVLLVLLRGHNL